MKKTKLILGNIIGVTFLFLVCVTFLSSCSKNDDLALNIVKEETVKADLPGGPIFIIPGIHVVEPSGCHDCIAEIYICVAYVSRVTESGVEVDMLIPDENNSIEESEPIALNVISYDSEETELDQEDVEDVLTYNSTTEVYTATSVETVNDVKYLTQIQYTIPE